MTFWGGPRFARGRPEPDFSPGANTRRDRGLPGRTRCRGYDSVPEPHRPLPRVQRSMAASLARCAFGNVPAVPRRSAPREDFRALPVLSPWGPLWIARTPGLDFQGLFLLLRRYSVRFFPDGGTVWGRWTYTMRTNLVCAAAKKRVIGSGESGGKRGVFDPGRVGRCRSQVFVAQTTDINISDTDTIVVASLLSSRPCFRASPVRCSGTR